MVFLNGLIAPILGLGYYEPVLGANIYFYIYVHTKLLEVIYTLRPQAFFVLKPSHKATKTMKTPN